MHMLTIGRLHRLAGVCECLVLGRLLRLSSEPVLGVLRTGCFLGEAALFSEEVYFEAYGSGSSLADTTPTPLTLNLQCLGNFFPLKYPSSIFYWENPASCMV